MKNEFYNKVMNDLKEHGYTHVVPENVGIMVENDNDIAIVDYNFMSTGIHYNKSEIDPQQVIEAGFKYFPTWNC